MGSVELSCKTLHVLILAKEAACRRHPRATQLSRRSATPIRQARGMESLLFLVAPEQTSLGAFGRRSEPLMCLERRSAREEAREIRDVQHIWMESLMTRCRGESRKVFRTPLSGFSFAKSHLLHGPSTARGPGRERSDVVRNPRPPPAAPAGAGACCVPHRLPLPVRQRRGSEGSLLVAQAEDVGVECGKDAVAPHARELRGGGRHDRRWDEMRSGRQAAFAAARGRHQARGKSKSRPRRSGLARSRDSA